MKSFLPQDARCIDIISALSMLGFAIHITSFGYTKQEFLNIREWPFWVLFLGALSTLQLVSVYLHPHTETLRAITGAVGGLFWIYLFLNTYYDSSSFPLSLFVGLGCLYSSVITTLYIGQAWKT